MKKVLFSLLFALLTVATPVKAWELTIPPQGHYAGELSDAAVLNGYVYAIGLETYINSETGYLFQCIGNTTLFKISPNGTPLTKYTIIGGFCDEEEWPSYGVESIEDTLIVSGMSCVPRFKNETIWIMALDDDGGYRWGISLPGYLTQVKIWNGSLIAAIAYGPKEHRTPMMLWIDPMSGEITRAYLLPPNHAVLTFDVNEKGEIIAAGYDYDMLSWAGIIYPNGTVKLWETGIEAWDGPSVWAVGNESNFLIAVGRSNGTYLINPITGNALFVKGIYPYALMVMNDSPVVVSTYGGKSILVRLNWNGSVRKTYSLGNFTVQFVSNGLMGGYTGGYPYEWHYYLAPFQPGREASLSLSALPVEAKLTERTYSLTPINVSVESFEPTIVTQNLERGTGLSVVTNPPGAKVYLNDVPMGRTPLSLSLNPGNYTLRLVKYGYDNTTLNLTIRPGEWKNVTVDLRPLMSNLEIDSDPRRASVYIDGVYRGETPLYITLTPGFHNLTLSVIDYQNYTKKIFLKPGEVKYLKVTLTPNFGYLLVDSTPQGAWVYVDGEIEGKTPLWFFVSRGEHEVKIVLKNYRPKTLTVEIQPNTPTIINESLEVIPATLLINSTPPNLTVLVTGENLTENCTAPCTLHLPPGSYKVNVTDGESWNATTVTLGPNTTATVLLKIPTTETPAKKGTPYLPLIMGVLLAATLGGAYLYLRRPGERRGGETTTQTEKAIEVKADKAFGISHVGARENNEDNLLVLKHPDAYLLAVADGLGGHNAGEVASQMAVDTLREVFEREYRKGMSDEDVKKLLEKAHGLAHGRIKENATGEREGMGTTLVTAFVRNGKAIIANTGDSRAYLIKDGKIVERTKDHSLVQEFVDKGEITPEEARRHPMKNIITKALGIDFGVDLYEWELEPGDVLLLSSDGLHDYVDEERIVGIASQGRSAEEIVRKLIEEALPVTKDNVTVVVWK